MYFVSVHIYSFHLTYLCLVLSVFQGSSFSFLPSSNLTKHMRGTISRSSSDEEFCRAPSPASSDSRYLFYRGLSSTPKKMSWFDYLYGRESAESGKNKAVMLKGKDPAFDNRSDSAYHGTNTLGFSDSESDCVG